MNQEFFETTLQPFLDTLLKNFEEDYKKSDQSLEEFFERYFALEESRLENLKRQTLDIGRSVTGSNLGIYQGVNPDEVVKVFITLLRERKKQSFNAAEFYNNFFLKGESNRETVRLNRRLFADKFDNTVLSLNSAQKQKVYTKTEQSRVRKLLVQVLGETRFKQIESQVFIGEDKLYISADLQLELEAKFETLLKNRFPSAEVTRVSFDMRDLAVKGKVKTDSDSKIVNADGDRVFLEEDINDQKASIKIDVDIKNESSKAAFLDKPTPKVAEKQNIKALELAKSAQTFKEHPDHSSKLPDTHAESGLPYTKLASAERATHIEENEIVPNKEARIKVQKAPARYSKSPALNYADNGNLGHKFEFHNKAKRYQEEKDNKKQKPDAANPRDERTDQNLRNNQFAGNQQGGEPQSRGANTQQQKKPNNAFKKIAGVSTLIAGAPIFGSLGVGVLFPLDLSGSSSKIALTLDSMNDVFLNIIHFFIV